MRLFAIMLILGVAAIAVTPTIMRASHGIQAAHLALTR